MKKNRVVSISVCLVTLLLCGCQKPPEKDVVISKNDGSFEHLITQTATQPSDAAQQETTHHETEPPRIQETFFSTDGSVEFIVNATLQSQPGPMPVVEVSPHRLTSEDAQRVAKVLLGNGPFYEADSIAEEVYSKAEIQEKMDRLLDYAGSINISDSIFYTARDNYITSCTELLKTAPDSVNRIPCDWHFRKSTYYYVTAEELKRTNTSQDNDELQVRAKVGGIPYLLRVVTRDRKDFKLNNINLTINDGVSPMMADMYIFQNMLCQQDVPDSAAIAAIEEKAAAMLKEMGLGDWSVDNSFVEVVTYNEPPEYVVTVTAVPSFCGTPALRRPQITGLKSENVYASNYYLTDVLFTFSPDGTLLSFKMVSPLNVERVINENVLTMSYPELIDRAREHLRLSDIGAYDYAGFFNWGYEGLGCRVQITNIQYGLTRVKIPNTDERYYYVPAMFFWGREEVYDTDSGEILRDTGKTDRLLLALNAVDGTVIHTSNQ